jgi:hypothetical protein
METEQKIPEWNPNNWASALLLSLQVLLVLINALKQ